MVYADETQASRAGALIESLTPREVEVLHLASRGSTNSEIGQRLGLTIHAVKFHLASVYRKLGVANRTEAAAAYLTASARPPSPTDKELA